MALESATLDTKPQETLASPRAGLGDAPAAAARAAPPPSGEEIAPLQPLQAPNTAPAPPPQPQQPRPQQPQPLAAFAGAGDAKDSGSGSGSAAVPITERLRACGRATAGSLQSAAATLRQHPCIGIAALAATLVFLAIGVASLVVAASRDARSRQEAAEGACARRPCCSDSLFLRRLAPFAKLSACLLVLTPLR